jgi:hypothetical protein
MTISRRTVLQAFGGQLSRSLGTFSRSILLMTLELTRLSVTARPCCVGCTKRFPKVACTTASG